MHLSFYKYQGTGNDFVILDNRDGKYDALSNEQVQFLCDRRFGIGADGLMLLNTKEGFDFYMKYYNADGRESTMCGNGGRCLVKFAWDLGLRKSKIHFLAVDGEHDAVVTEKGWVNLKMIDVHGVREYFGDQILQTGSPHYVKIVPSADEIDVFEEGRDIRYSKDFATEGINVNFLEITGDDTIRVRTYERGVEDETYSCGTGVTAAALVAAHNDNGFNRVEVSTKGGTLSVEYDKHGEEDFSNIWLCGPAERVFEGSISI